MMADVSNGAHPPFCPGCEGECPGCENEKKPVFTGFVRAVRAVRAFGATSPYNREKNICPWCVVLTPMFFLFLFIESKKSPDSPDKGPFSKA